MQAKRDLDGRGRVLHEHAADVLDRHRTDEGAAEGGGGGGGGDFGGGGGGGGGGCGGGGGLADDGEGCSTSTVSTVTVRLQFDSTFKVLFEVL